MKHFCKKQYPCKTSVEVLVDVCKCIEKLRKEPQAIREQGLPLGREWNGEGGEHSILCCMMHNEVCSVFKITVANTLRTKACPPPAFSHLGTCEPRALCAGAGLPAPLTHLPVGPSWGGQLPEPPSPSENGSSGDDKLSALAHLGHEVTCGLCG